MTGTKGRPELLTVPVSGWCDPDTGVCHIDTAAGEASPGQQPTPDDPATPGGPPEARDE